MKQNKKVGIFTYMQLNYGAVLQAYALRKYFSDLGADAEIIDFTTANHIKNNRIFADSGFTNPLKKFVYFLLTCRKYPQFKRRRSLTEQFKKQYFNLTRRYPTVDDLLQNHPEEDIYVTGSDQVFNPAKEYLPVYYLGFDKGDAVKMAYSPSFGISEFPVPFEEKVKGYLSDFDYLSCRERVGADYLSLITGKPVPTLTDPVFLLTPEQWHSIAKPPKAGGYIFVYDLHGDRRNAEIARIIQSKTGLPIYCLSMNVVQRYPVQKQFSDAGPAEFVGWIENASYVVTDSFHGTSFSLIFSRPFITYLGSETTSSRMTNLLGHFGLENHIVRLSQVDDTVMDKIEFHEKINLLPFVDESKKYIQKVLSDHE